MLKGMMLKNMEISRKLRMVLCRIRINKYHVRRKLQGNQLLRAKSKARIT